MEVSICRRISPKPPESLRKCRIETILRYLMNDPCIVATVTSSPGQIFNGRTKELKREKVTRTNVEFEFTFSKKRCAGLSPRFLRIADRWWPPAVLANAAAARVSDDSLGRPPVPVHSRDQCVPICFIEPDQVRGAGRCFSNRSYTILSFTLGPPHLRYASQATRVQNWSGRRPDGLLSRPSLPLACDADIPRGKEADELVGLPTSRGSNLFVADHEEPDQNQIAR